MVIDAIPIKIKLTNPIPDRWDIMKIIPKKRITIIGITKFNDCSFE